MGPKGRGRGRLIMSDVVRFSDARLGRPGPGISSWSWAERAVAGWASDSSRIGMMREIMRAMACNLLGNLKLFQLYMSDVRLLGLHIRSRQDGNLL